jgi:hypothetical protein
MVKITIGMTNYNTVKLMPFKVLSYKLFDNTHSVIGDITVLMRIFYIILIYCALLTPLSEAFAFNPLTKQENGDKLISFLEILNLKSKIQNRLSNERKPFEELTTYEARIKNYTFEWNSFLKNKYWINFQPETIELDWENSQIRIQQDFGIGVLRKRGSKNSNLLIININVQANKIREIYTFKDKIYVKCLFGLTSGHSIIIYKLIVKYRDEVVYDE